MQLHELNEGFQWEDRTGPFRILTAEQAQAYNRDGFVVLDNVFDDATIDSLAAELDPLEEQRTAELRAPQESARSISRPDEITFNAHVVLHSEQARAFTRQPFFADITFDLLGPDVRLYWDQTVYKKPGNPEDFPWHQDNGYTFTEPQQYLTCWVALSDANEANGCPWVLPGAHRRGTYAHRWTDLGFACTQGHPEERVCAPVNKGGVVVFSSLTPHMTGPNLTDQLRKTYIVQFAPDEANVILKKDGVLRRSPCADPGRQYRILTNGEPVGP